MSKLYIVRLWFTKLSPPALHGLIPRIGKKKLLERLKRDYNLSERDLEKFRSEDGYWIPLGGGWALDIKPVEDC